MERRVGPGAAERRAAMFAEAGLPYAPGLDRIPRSLGAQMVAEWARERGAFDALHPRLFDAYWGRARDIGDEQVLIEEAAAVGLAEDEVAQALRDERAAERIEAETQAAMQLGVSGVPAWVVDQRVLVGGAQPHDVFDQVLARLGHRPLDGALP